MRDYSKIDLKKEPILMDELLAEARSGKVKEGLSVGQLEWLRWELMNDYKKKLKTNMKK